MGKLCQIFQYLSCKLGSGLIWRLSLYKLGNSGLTYIAIRTIHLLVLMATPSYPSLIWPQHSEFQRWTPLVQDQRYSRRLQCIERVFCAHAWSRLLAQSVNLIVTPGES